MNCELIINELVSWTKEYVKNAGADGVVFGLSGGIDSTVVAAIMKKAFGNNAIGIIMPINSLNSDMDDAENFAKLINLQYLVMDLTDNYNDLAKKFEKSNNLMAYANIKPRLRMVTLYYYGQSNNFLVSGTTNLSEYTIGYSTKYGDSGVDFSPIIDFTKTEILELAKFLDIPEYLIEKKPSAGLWDGQSDEDELGFSYKELDDYILTGKGSDNLIKKVEHMKKISRHKKEMPEKFRYNRGE